MSVHGSSFKVKREDLYTALPLDTPFSLLADPSSVCNFNCRFCPCANSNKKNWGEKKTGMMSYELFRKLTDDLTEFPHRLKTLRLYKEGEPLLNKRIPDMISYAKRMNVADEINLTTNGSLLTHDLSLALVDAGLDRINISVEALDADGYLRISGIKLDFDRFMNELEFLYKHKEQCHIFMKITDAGLDGRDEKEFFERFDALCDEFAVEYIKPVWPGFDVSETDASRDIDTYGRAQEERKIPQVCPYLFYTMCVNSDGTVSPCCVDWDHRLIIGDIKKQSLLSVWNGEAIKEMRRNHLMLNRAVYKSCANCGQLRYCTHDNIDEHRTELLEKG